MNRRLIAFILAVCVALQSLVPTLTQARADDATTTAHCAEMTPSSVSHTNHSPGDSLDEPGCPHCNHSGSSHGGCASQCLFAIALLPAATDLTIQSCHARVEAATLPSPTRFDIPPTPPPIR